MAVPVEIFKIVVYTNKNHTEILVLVSLISIVVHIDKTTYACAAMLLQPIILV